MGPLYLIAQYSLLVLYEGKAVSGWNLYKETVCIEAGPSTEHVVCLFKDVFSEGLIVYWTRDCEFMQIGLFHLSTNQTPLAAGSQYIHICIC